MSAVDKLLAVARAEVGYLEKRTNADLYSKTGNAGYNNFTKYAAELDGMGMVYNGPKNGYYWCDVFVDWCFIKAFGKDMGMKILYQPANSLGASCTYSAGYYQRHGAFFRSPKVGDQIFFTYGGDGFDHTGIVTKVANGRVYTIEGNTSGASGVVANGGGVCEKSYPLGYYLIGGYGRPNYSLYKEGEKVTYDEFKKYMAKYEQEKTAKGISDWAKPAVEYCREHGIMKGDADGKFRPQSSITRQEVAQVAMNLHKSRE